MRFVDLRLVKLYSVAAYQAIKESYAWSSDCGVILALAAGLVKVEGDRIWKRQC